MRNKMQSYKKNGINPSRFFKSSQILCYAYEILYGEAFGAERQQRVFAEGGGGGKEPREGVAEGLAALAEGCLHHSLEELGIAPQICARVAGEAKHSAHHLRRGIEHSRGDIEEIFAVIPCLQKHGEYAVDLRARLGAYALRHLLLEHAGHYRDLLPVVEHLEEYLRGDVVGIVAYQRELSGEELLEVHLQEVAFYHLKVGKDPLEKAHALCIELHGLHLTSGLHEELREHTHAGAYLQHRDVAPSLRAFGELWGLDGVGYPPCDIEVGEKVLAQRLLSFYFCHIGGIFRNECVGTGVQFLNLREMEEGIASLLTITLRVFSRKKGSET